MVRWLNSKGLPGRDPWPASLKHSSINAKARPFVIWALGSNITTLRESCDSLSAALADIPGYAPILITDTADFAYYSRLGWLVEYLPDLSGEGKAFQSRKKQLLARLYRDAPALPLQVGRLPKQELVNILQRHLN
jgi:hypothetical protein